MAYRGLDEFLIRLEQSNEITVITQSIQPDERLTAAVRARGDKALRFDSVAGSPFPVVTNLYGSPRRMAWALGVDHLDELGEKLAALITLDEPLSFGALMARAGMLMSALRSAGAGVSRPKDFPAAEVRDTRLTALPAVRFYPQETHPSITMAQIITAAPNGKQTVHLARAVVLGEDALGVELRHHQTLQGESIPAAVVIGGDPAAMWCANVPLPANVAPYWLAGWLRRKAVPFCRATTQPVDVPADAEIIIEGRIDADDIRRDVIFAGNGGLFVDSAAFAVFRVTAITHRQDALFPVHIPAPLSAEYYWMNKATERLFAPVLKLLLDEVCDINQPQVGAARNLTIISCRQNRRGVARKALHGLWGLGGLAQGKAVIAVDAGVNVHDLEAVARAVAWNVDARRDLMIADGMVHPHDASGDEPGYSGKIAVDATRKSESAPPDLPPFDASGMDQPPQIWENVAIIPACADLDHLTAANPDYHIVRVCADTRTGDLERVAWDVLALADWSRHLCISAAGRLIIDISAAQVDQRIE
jgi:4-hydroxy-3-polyprenylbenzoate decarboxylase